MPPAERRRFSAKIALRIEGEMEIDLGGKWGRDIKISEGEARWTALHFAFVMIINIIRRCPNNGRLLSLPPIGNKTMHNPKRL